MARAISDEELQLRKRARRRLIGAIVIVTAVVVALPMVLDNEPRPLTQDIDIRIPSPESAGPFTSKVVPVPESPAKSAATAKPAPGAEAKAPPAQAKPVPGSSAQGTAKADTSTPAEGPVKQAAPKPEKSAAPAKAEQQETKALAPASGQYVVQVVALSDAGKAKQMQQAILKTGVSSYTEIVKTARGDVTRVRAGPFATREAAEKAQQKLKSAGFDGKVVPTR
ncbi:MAG: SPOR domain-containing protein [Betaproteobacteria bacterium]